MAYCILLVLAQPDQLIDNYMYDYLTYSSTAAVFCEHCCLATVFMSKINDDDDDDNDDYDDEDAVVDWQVKAAHLCHAVTLPNAQCHTYR